jgi:hypothetical protein
MPKEKQHSPAKPTVDHHISVEASAHLSGLFHEFHRQQQSYLQLTAALHSLEARIGLAEKMLSLTRDHLAMTISQTDSATPRDWEPILKQVRFVGVRLADACMALLQEKKKMTPEHLLMALNEGMFRFRTNSPQREIHAAMLRQNFAKRQGDDWLWIGKSEHQLPIPLRPAARLSEQNGSTKGVGK